MAHLGCDSRCYDNSAMRRVETLPARLEGKNEVNQNYSVESAERTQRGHLSKSDSACSNENGEPNSCTGSESSLTEKSGHSKRHFFRRISGADDDDKGKTTTKSQSVKETCRGRFKKILRPLRRSQSTGCAKDTPAHALFLRHEYPFTDSQKEVRSCTLILHVPFVTFMFKLSCFLKSLCIT